MRSDQISFSVFDGVHGNPIEQNILSGVDCYKRENCDVVIGIGGGSPLDVAKLICLKSTHDLSLSEYDDLKNGSEKIGSNVPSWIAIPTTAGTGSEVGRSGVVTLESTDRKTVIFSPHLLAKTVIADPELTIGLPKNLTAATGMDALTHSVEAFLSPNFHPICDGIAIESIRLVHENLQRAFDDGKDLIARGNMLVAAMMGAIAFQKGLGVAHSLAHPLSTIAGLHHGLANAIMLPHAIEFNKITAKNQLLRIAEIFGVETVSGLIDAISEMNRKLEIPSTLSEVGVSAEIIPRLAEDAILDGCHLTNPRPCEIEDMIELYRSAI